MKTLHIKDLVEKARPLDERWPALWRVECLALAAHKMEHVEEEHVVYALTEHHEEIPRYEDIDLKDAGLAVLCVNKIEYVGWTPLGGFTGHDPHPEEDTTFVFGIDLTV